jgi:hypothetical protein
MGECGLAVLMFPCGGRVRELLAVTAAVGIPPIGHKDSWAFLIHVWFPFGGGGWSPSLPPGIIAPSGRIGKRSPPSVDNYALTVWLGQ